jgi:hypothetical protein
MVEKIHDIFLKEYEVMRAEIRLYINKLYLGLSVIVGLLTLGIFKSNPKEAGFICLWIPYVITGVVGYMTMVSFFINKTAGYVRLLEHRIARMHNTIIPVDTNLSRKIIFPLSPMFWESFYADYNMKRDTGEVFKSLYMIALNGMIIGGLIMIGFVVSLGYFEAIKWHIMYRIKPSGYLPFEVTGILYVATSALSVGSSLFTFVWVGGTNRRKLGELNNKLLENPEPWESRKESGIEIK